MSIVNCLIFDQTKFLKQIDLMRYPLYSDLSVCVMGGNGLSRSRCVFWAGLNSIKTQTTCLNRSKSKIEDGNGEYKNI